MAWRPLSWFIGATGGAVTTVIIELWEGLEQHHRENGGDASQRTRAENKPQVSITTIS